MKSDANLFRLENEIISESKLIKHIQTSISKIPLPDLKHNTSEVCYGISPKDKVGRTDSIDNYRFEFFVGSKGKVWYVKLENYTYYRLGPVDMPGESLNIKSFFKFIKSSRKLKPSRNPNIDTWKNIKDVDN